MILITYEFKGKILTKYCAHEEKADAFIRSWRSAKGWKLLQDSRF